ncbi:MAG: twin-arginine translocation signal domain-containing protein [Adlercreutzia equolifaciens]
MKEFGKKGAISRRSFLAALGLAGASAAGAGSLPAAPRSSQPRQLATTRPPSLTLAPWWKPTSPRTRLSRRLIATCAWLAWAWRG